MIVAKAQGHGMTCTCSVQAWILDLVREGTLSFHSYGYTRKMALEDEDVLKKIQEALSERERAGFVKAEDICDIVTSERLQSLFACLGIQKPSISLSMAQRWLAKMNWRYSKTKKGIYIDGYERDDVVAYRNTFAKQWAGYESRFQIWDDDGNPLPRLSDSFPLILVTHDESTFFQNDEQKTSWSYQDSQPAPKPKGEGQSLMVSDFLTADWGCLH